MEQSNSNIINFENNKFFMKIPHFDIILLYLKNINKKIAYNKEFLNLFRISDFIIFQN